MSKGIQLLIVSFVLIVVSVLLIKEVRISDSERTKRMELEATVSDQIYHMEIQQELLDKLVLGGEGAIIDSIMAFIRYKDSAWHGQTFLFIPESLVIHYGDSSEVTE